MLDLKTLDESDANWFNDKGPKQCCTIFYSGLPKYDSIVNNICENLIYMQLKSQRYGNNYNALINKEVYDAKIAPK